VARATEVSRIEGFSDAVFGFALTLLVVSTAVPEDFADLRRILEGFPAFAATFTSICWVWYEHYLFFRRYPLQDGFTVVLNSILLFVVVFYSYPLKFMFTRLINGNLLNLGPGIDDGLTWADSRMLMMAYSAGFVAVFGVFALLHWHALRRANTLQLGALARYDARGSLTRHSINVALGTASLLMAWLLPPALGALAGLIYFLLGPLHGGFGFYNGRRRDRLEASL
jgi:uncharacterized membrane protein